MKPATPTRRARWSPFAIAVSSAILVLGSAFLLVACQEAFSRNQASPPERAKIVFIAGEPSHPSGQHEFNAGAILLSRALNEQSGLPLSVDVVHNGWPEDEKVFEGADAVIIYSDGNSRHPVNGQEEKMVHVKLPSEEDLTQPAAEPKAFGWPGKPKD